MKLAALALAIIVSSVSVSVSVAHADPTKDVETAAAAVYPLLTAEWKAGKRSAIEVGAWSVRWLDASLDAGAAADKAFADHLARMTDLDTLEQKNVKAGLAGPADAAITGYYRTQAALWKARGKK